ncbi:glycoside hydrolase family 19 protein [Malikia sp.]|uniref:glycoside hydrolase family 19 protein n=1 Tax=Malikia sp. TaxID=2070706 RepID=UPI002609AA82|nr:glycoside hydrolase family 19 protein [Malikia sp.]MDD2728157.1 glycoside hydrolase family 19 protein [Malikia sp.]
MTLLTSQQLQAATGCTPERATRWLPHIERACQLYGITSPKRLAAFLAQIGHESGRLRYVREIWGPTRAQAGYEGRADLGNRLPGDGKRFAGRGLIQITGRFNYRAVRAGLKLVRKDVPDFEHSPELLEQPEWAALSAAWYWYSRSLSALADAGDFERITRKINGGLNGQAERVALYGAAMEALA